MKIETLAEMSVSRVVSAISEIVKHSSNRQFQENCKGILDAKNTADFEQRLVELLASLVQSKGKNKRRAEVPAILGHAQWDDSFVLEDLEAEEF